MATDKNETNTAKGSARITKSMIVAANRIQNPAWRKFAAREISSGAVVAFPSSAHSAICDPRAWLFGYQPFLPKNWDTNFGFFSPFAALPRAARRSRAAALVGLISMIFEYTSHARKGSSILSSSSAK